MCGKYNFSCTPQFVIWPTSWVQVSHWKDILLFRSLRTSGTIVGSCVKWLDDIAHFTTTNILYSGVSQNYMRFYNFSSKTLTTLKDVGKYVGLLSFIFMCSSRSINLTHWGRVTHICVSKLTIIGLDNGLSPGRCQAIIWTNAGILLIWPLGTSLNEILIEIHTFLFKKMHLKLSSGKRRPFSLGLNVILGKTEPSTEAYANKY